MKTTQLLNEATAPKTKIWLLVNDEGAAEAAEAYSTLDGVIKAVLDQMEDDFDSVEGHEAALAKTKTLAQLQKLTQGTMMGESIILEFIVDSGKTPKVTRL